MTQMKRLIIFILVIITLFCNNNVKAYSASANTDGDSYQTTWDECDGPGSPGCAGWSDDFIIRVTLIDKDKNKVKGTKIIEFYPNNEDDKNGKPTHINNPESTREKVKPSEIESKINLGNLYKSTKSRSFVIIGSNTANNAEEMYEKYQINMGIGPTKIEENFENYNTIRKGFIDYATNSKEKKIKVFDENEKKYKKITFVDYFLKVSGFTDKWEASQDIETRKKLAEKDYYLLIEPVYEYSVNNSLGKNIQIRGTAKELAAVMYNNTVQMGDKPWFWVPFNAKIAYNHYCNFIEKGERKLFPIDKSKRCGDITSFEFYTEKQKEIYSVEIPSGPLGSLMGPLIKGMTTVINTIMFMTDRAQTIHGDMKNQNSNIGVNVINLGETMKKFPDPTPNIDNECELITTNCQNNSYTFTSKLSGKDIAACVFPKYSNGDTNQLKNSVLKKVVYTSDATNEKQRLWCYDDVTYDFKELKNYMMAHKYLTSTQLLQIPAGRLTVSRTCYSAEKNNNINSVFKTDPVLTDTKVPTAAKYLETIPFKIGNNTYNYKLYKTKYQIKNNKRITNNFETSITKTEDKPEFSSSTKNIEYYTYKQTFYYDYILDAGTDAYNKYLGIRDLQINPSSSTVSIKLDAKENSKIIQNPIKENGKSVAGSLSFGEGLGLSYKIFDAVNNKGNISDPAEKVSEDATKTVVKYSPTKKGKYESYSLANVKNTYIRNRGKQNICEFATTTTDKNIEFRIIDLSNPFPGRDGTSRIPGEEWISKDKNNVYKYIQRNRGVNGDKVYNKKPLYTITLTPSVMSKLREYNKDHDYSYISVSCEHGTGRKCISSIVHSSNYGITGGTCKDLDIGKTGNYYTCANKDEKSGG